MVILKNVSRHLPFQITLAHEVVCARTGECLCETRRRMVPGKTKPVVERIPRSIQLMPGETSEPLPMAVKAIGQVRVALERGVITMEELPIQPVLVPAEGGDA